MIPYRIKQALSASIRLYLRAFSTGVLLLSIACTGHVAPTQPAPDTDTAPLEALIEVMGQRLALMPVVAEWKRAHQKPVRDRIRELQVLAEAVAAVDAAARKVGVEPFPEDAVRRFYQAQIDLAVEIQEHILSQPPTPLAKAIPDLITEVRPELDLLGARIASLLVVQCELPNRPRLEELARQHWQIDGLKAQAIRHLVSALEQLLAARRPV